MKVEAVTLRVPRALSALSMAPARAATLPTNAEPDTTRRPLPRVSPLSIAPPSPLMALLPENVEPETVTLPWPSTSALAIAPPSSFSA